MRAGWVKTTSAGEKYPAKALISSDYCCKDLGRHCFASAPGCAENPASRREKACDRPEKALFTQPFAPLGSTAPKDCPAICGFQSFAKSVGPFASKIRCRLQMLFHNSSIIT